MKKTLSVISIFIFFNKFVNCSFCGSGGWVAFTDEKCFKLVNKLEPHEEAEQICNNQAKASPALNFLPTLASIKSLEEQQFLKRYLFLENGAVESIWTSAKRKSDSESEFEWSDGSELEYDNWAEGNPTNNTNRKCVQIQTKFNFKNNTISKQKNVTLSTNEGKWIDVPCEKRNLVLCEKLQIWSFAQIQKSYIETRKNLIKSNQEITALKQSIYDLQQNPVPIGFIYTQLPGQPEPMTLWPITEWVDVSSEYSGLFFRVLGGDSAAFGEIQNENSPRIVEIQNIFRDRSLSQGTPHNTTLKLATGDVSNYIHTGDINMDWAITRYQAFLNFGVSGGEVRPRNQAIHIWKRTQQEKR